MDIRRSIIKLVRLLGKSGIRKIFPRTSLRVFKILFPHLLAREADVLGHKMYLDPQDSLMLSYYEIHEPIETEMVQKVITKGSVVVDVGANIGYYTLLFARSAGEEGKVFSFEPSPDNFALLKKNVETNGYRNVEMVNRAISDKPGTTRLYINKESAGGHRVYQSESGEDYVEVESIRLEDYFKDFDRDVDVIKLDIEGWEYYAIMGMKSIIEKSPKIRIFMEFYPDYIRKSGADPEAILDFFEKCGLTILAIDEHKKEIRRAGKAELLSIKNEDQVNIFCFKGAFEDLGLGGMEYFKAALPQA